MAVFNDESFGFTIELMVHKKESCLHDKEAGNEPVKEKNKENIPLVRTLGTNLLH